MAVVAHIDSGKTTLTESILFETSYLTATGSVDTGSTTTDFLPAERERGITIQSASIPVKWQGWTFNLIDTPGHADFGMEVESASRVVDGAVVLIDSVEGVEAQTKGVWRQLDRYHVPTRIVFLNKLDRPGASFSNSIKSLLSHRLHPKPTALTLPVASFDPHSYNVAEPGIEGLVDLVQWEVWRWPGEGEQKYTRTALPRNVDELANSGLFPEGHPLLPELATARQSLLENLSMSSESLMDTLLCLPSTPSAYLSVETSTILPEIRALTLSNEILPVLCGSAIKGIGTEIVLDYVGHLLASPLDVPHDKQSPKSPVRLLAWKVGWDKRKGWMTFVRVYSGMPDVYNWRMGLTDGAGTLKRQSSVFNITRNQKEKVSKLLLLYANEAEEVEELSFGSVGVVLGLKYTRTGDTLVAPASKVIESTVSRVITPPQAVMSASIIPQSHGDLEPVQEALHALSRTDPSVRIESQEGQLLVHGLGQLHLEIVEGRLRDEWNVNFEVGKRRVSYREGLGPGAQKEKGDSWQTELHGKPVNVIVWMKIRALDPLEKGNPAWDDNVVIDKDGKPYPSPESFARPDDPMASIARGISDALSNSPHTSLPLSHLHIQITGHRYPEEFPSSVLAGASAYILRNHIREFGPGPVMEPFIRVKVTVNEDSLGKVVNDLTENGGQIQDLAADTTTASGGEDEMEAYSADLVYIAPEWLSPSSSSLSESNTGARLKRSIYALAPLSQMLDYSNRLRALSGGHGLFEMANAGFHEVSESRKLEILKEIGRA
ncbi:P-loop containing nucleoside triphosphate hydrolase protein [Neolentinus lepideus HHB14362 ss-1]|uniref:p-loop containing nucleoside triphosphate hydrolase protein n=1 Tax=Neolentinus lepideus HHB14362 ss-1 TaxID=1314782 RepID=A0A165P1S8_9AGAM|nr:P-loop containing nucleoside triphosphate hydrolase protein [Neolentinus lepideus HHB14362 ss-1]